MINFINRTQKLRFPWKQYINSTQTRITPLLERSVVRYQIIYPVTVFPVSNFWNCEVQRLLEGGTYFKVREVNNIKCQNFAIFAPLKKNFLRHNNPFMTKDLRKQIMVLSKLRSIFNKNRNYENWCKYNCQRNLCLNLLRKNKKFLSKPWWKTSIW